MVFNHMNITFQRRILFTINQLFNHILTTMNEKCINSFNFFFHTDVNECLSINGNCSQICTNTLGSYYCSCTAGYMLNADNQTCVGKKIMLWSFRQVFSII